MKRTSRDVLTGMIFSNLILYFILLATGITLHAAGRTEIETAADAAAALEPIAGQAAKFLFAAGVVGVGFLAVPVMTTGAAYDVVQGLGRAGSLHDAPQDNRLRSEEHTSELQSLMRISYAVFCLEKKK